MKKKPLVSIITPVFNGADFIQETIESVILQTYNNWEWIIVDDGSIDDSCQKIESFEDKRIRLLKKPHSGLPAVGRNVGLKSAKGNYIAFLDSDDLWLPDKLEKQIKVFEKHNNLLFVATNLMYFPPPFKGGLILLKDKRVNFNNLLFSNIISNSSVMLKKEVLDIIGFLDENPHLKAVEDYDFWLRILRYRDNSCLILKERLMKYRIHTSNISHQKMQGDITPYERICIIYDKYNTEKNDIVKKAKTHASHILHSSVIKDSYLSGNLSLKGLLTNSELSTLEKTITLLKPTLLKITGVVNNYRPRR